MDGRQVVPTASLSEVVCSEVLLTSEAALDSASSLTTSFLLPSISSSEQPLSHISFSPALMGERGNDVHTADFTCVRIFRVAYGIAFCVGQRIVLIHIPALLWYGRSYAKRNTEMFERK